MEIFGTLGPALLTEPKLGALIDAGVTIFRINGAHSDGVGTTRMIEEVRRLVGDRAKIMVDLPTNKIRVRNLSDPIVFGPRTPPRAFGARMSQASARMLASPGRASRTSTGCPSKVLPNSVPSSPRGA